MRRPPTGWRRWVPPLAAMSCRAGSRLAATGAGRLWELAKKLRALAGFLEEEPRRRPVSTDEEDLP